MRNTLKKNRGFVKMIILIILALVILKFVFGITLKDITESKLVGDLWSIIKSIIQLFWDAILATIDFAKLLLVKTKEFIGSLRVK